MEVRLMLVQLPSPRMAGARVWRYEEDDRTGAHRNGNQEPSIVLLENGS